VYLHSQLEALQSGNGELGVALSTSRKRLPAIAFTASQAPALDTIDVARYGFLANRLVLFEPFRIVPVRKYATNRNTTKVKSVIIKARLTFFIIQILVSF
jgi:hypothetical protein